MLVGIAVKHVFKFTGMIPGIHYLYFIKRTRYIYHPVITPLYYTVSVFISQHIIVTDLYFLRFRFQGTVPVIVVEPGKRKGIIHRIATEGRYISRYCQRLPHLGIKTHVKMDLHHSSFSYRSVLPKGHEDKCLNRDL